MSVVKGFRTSEQRYGRYWGQREVRKAEAGRWEMGLNSKFNGPTLGIDYLAVRDEVRGRVVVKQLRVLGQTIRLQGSVQEVTEGAILNLLNEERLIRSPETITEIALFVAELQRQQRLDEKEWLYIDGRGTYSKDEKISAETVVLQGIQKLNKEERISDALAEGMRDYFKIPSRELDQTEERGVVLAGQELF